MRWWQREIAEREYELRTRTASTPLAYRLQEKVMSALPLAKGLVADQLYSFSEQLEDCMRRRQEPSRESMRLVLGVVNKVQNERRTA